MKLRIAEVATLGRPVPPPGEGSVEFLVSLITEGLVSRGNEVTLFARADSRTTASLESPVPRGYEGATWDWQIYEAYQVREVFRQWRRFDLIHCHSYHHALMFSCFVRIPVLLTLHLDPGPDLLFLAERTPSCHLHFASEFQARDFGMIRRKSIIPFGLSAPEVDMATWGGGDYVAFLGRFIPDKGILEAIQACRKAGKRLVMAAPANDYYHEQIAHLVDGDQVIHAGELGGQAKDVFLAQASALIYPNLRGEPFGLVLVEAMLAGTPVVARSIGAAPEIVSHGETGWLAPDLDGLVHGLGRVAALDRPSIREKALGRFSAARMLDELEDLMGKMARGECK